jgi:hypothetical protein
MQKIIILYNQSLLDVAIQHTGGIESLFDFAIENGLSVTDDLKVGHFLTSTKIVNNNDVVQYYKDRNTQPASGFFSNGKVNLEIGIGKMIIGTNFIIT